MASSSAARIVIISGPSGAGKSTVVRRLLAECSLPLQLSISATTRAPRAGEQNGVHYHFLTREEFAQRQVSGDFLECNEVFGRGDWYGTLEQHVQAGLSAGKWMVLEIDVEGAMAVLARYPKAITIFVHSGSMEELERRLRERGTETEDSLQRRLQVARKELNYLPKYKHEVVNDTIEHAVQKICELLRSYQ